MKIGHALVSAVAHITFFRPEKDFAQILDSDVRVRISDNVARFRVENGAFHVLKLPERKQRRGRNFKQNDIRLTFALPEPVAPETFFGGILYRADAGIRLDCLFPTECNIAILHVRVPRTRIHDPRTRIRDKRTDQRRIL